MNSHKNTLEVFLTQQRIVMHNLVELLDIQDFLNKQIHIKSQMPSFEQQVTYQTTQQVHVPITAQVETMEQNFQVKETSPEAPRVTEKPKKQKKNGKMSYVDKLKEMPKDEVVAETTQTSQATTSQTTQVNTNATFTETGKFDVDDVDEAPKVESIERFCGNKKCSCLHFLKPNEDLDASTIDGTKLFIAGLPTKLSWERVRNGLGEVLGPELRPLHTKIPGIKCNTQDCYELVEERGHFCETHGGKTNPIQSNRGIGRMSFKTHEQAVAACKKLRTSDLYGGSFWVNFVINKANK